MWFQQYITPEPGCIASTALVMNFSLSAIHLRGHTSQPLELLEKQFLAVCCAPLMQQYQQWHYRGSYNLNLGM